MLLEVLPVRFAGLRESSGTRNRICTNSGPILIEFGMGPFVLLIVFCDAGIGADPDAPLPETSSDLGFCAGARRVSLWKRSDISGAIRLYEPSTAASAAG